MTETLRHSPEAHDTPADWGRVFGRIEQLGLPEDIHERAHDMVHYFGDGVDVEMFGRALHDVLVPDVESVPVLRTMRATNLETGEVTRSFAAPEMRADVYQRAADAIKQLDTLRTSPEDDDAFLARVANVIALTIGQAHSYENGNGRLARVSAELIRCGTEYKDDLMLIGGARERTKRELGRSLPTFIQRYESIDKGDSDEDVIAAAASLDIPLTSRKVYEEKASDIFSSTSGF